jgi:hypothetical protein
MILSRRPRRSRRPLVALALAFLLVGMQYGAQLHALEHVGNSLKHTPDHSWTVPGSELCAMCALFAGGASALSGESTAGFVAPDVREIAPAPYASLATRVPSYYSSRAPPSLL